MDTLLPLIQRERVSEQMSANGRGQQRVGGWVCVWRERERERGLLSVSLSLSLSVSLSLSLSVCLCLCL